MLTRSTALFTCLFALLLGSSALSHAAVEGHYRWTDDSGKTHYSDRPPSGVDAEFIKFSSSKKSPPQPQEKATPAVSDQNNPSAEGTLEIVPESQKDPQLCAQAQSNLKALSGNPKVRITEADGSKRLLSDSEKEQQRERARGFIKLYCE